MVRAPTREAFWLGNSQKILIGGQFAVPVVWAVRIWKWTHRRHLQTRTVPKILKILRMDVTRLMKRIAILGSTGSIGRSTLSIVESYPDRFQIATLAAGNNLEAVYEQSLRYRPQVVSVAHEADADSLRKKLRAAGLTRTEVVHAPPAPSALPPIPMSISWSAPSSASPDSKLLTKPSAPANPSA